MFFLIIDDVSKEVTEEKINNWKNLTVKLTTTLDSSDFSDNYIKILEDLTAFDLTVLFVIYATDFKSKFFQKELTEYFSKRAMSEDKVFHSLKGLARHYLITEQANGMTYLSSGEASGQKFFYEKNSLGKEFLEIIQD